MGKRTGIDLRVAVFFILIGLGLCANSYAQAIEDWCSSFDGDALYASDYGTDVAIDDAGDVYVVGYAQMDSTLSSDLVVIKYDFYGQILWSDILNTHSTDGERDAYIALDNSYNVYILGETQRDTLTNDLILLKYSYDGIEQWETTYNNPYTGVLAPSEFSIDLLGNIYFSATSINTDENVHGNIITVKYAADGTFRWDETIPALTRTRSYSSSLAIDSNGDVCVAGATVEPDGRFGTEIVKYSSSGQQIWIVQYGNPDSAGGALIPRFIGLDAAGNVYVTGKIYTSNGQILFHTTKFDINGLLLWSADFSGFTGTGDDNGLARPSDMIVKPDGNLFVTGTCYHNDSDSTVCYSYGTVKYNTNGQEQWASFYNGVHLYSENDPLDMAIDLNDNIYVTGASYDIRNYAYDYATVKYNTSGEQEWESRHDSPISRTDMALAVAVNSIGDVAITGFCDEGNHFYVDDNIVTIKYSQDQSDLHESSPARPEKPVLLSNYPNPFNAQTTISYIMPQPGSATLSVYNLLGQKITTLFDGVQQEGEHKIVWDARDVTSGVYCYSLRTGEILDTRRMMLLK
jgi:hypothetical protein